MQLVLGAVLRHLLLVLPPGGFRAAVIFHLIGAAALGALAARGWLASRSLDAPIERGAAGAAVLVISQDLDELLALTDRLAVINLGVLSGTLVTADASLDEIGLLMGGLHGMDEHAPAHGDVAHVA